LILRSTTDSMQGMTPLEAKKFAEDLLVEHGLTGWVVRLDNAKRRAGQCTCATRTISLSRVLIRARTDQGTQDTIRHEVAHALTPGHHHDAVWSAKFKELGGHGNRQYDTTTIVKSIEARYKGSCPSCGQIITAHRRPERVKTCGICDPRYNLKYAIQWRDRGRPITVVDKPRQRRVSRPRSRPFEVSFVDFV
jgi:predicted SprT family Zn-dependent metalloprotease